MNPFVQRINRERERKIQMEELLKALQKNICVVSYEKIDTGERRDMECTLDPSRSPKMTYSLNQRPENDHIVVYALDREAWRSFRVSTMVDWKIK